MHAIRTCSLFCFQISLYLWSTACHKVPVSAVRPIINMAKDGMNCHPRYIEMSMMTVANINMMTVQMMNFFISFKCYFVNCMFL
ncbi:MAG TPA: hypothetical protein DCS83_06165 [Prevotella sp.]|nr:hypothetical protein [Prevotella sp.]